MNPFPHALVLLACATALFVPGTDCADNLSPGQVLTIALREDLPGGEAARAAYFEHVLPVSRAAGMRELAAFEVEQVLVGDAAPQAAGLYLWPDRATVRAVRDDPRHVQESAPLRAAAWKQLQAVDVAIAAPQDLEIDRSRPHTLALIWIRDRAEYDRYYAGTAALRERLGIRALLKLPAARYEKLAEGEVAPPHMVLLMSWDSAEAIDAYLRSDEFQAHRAHFERGVERLEWYRLGVRD